MIHTFNPSGPDQERKWLVQKKPTVARFTNTALSIMFSVVGIVLIAFVILCTFMYVTDRKRDADQ